MKTANTHTHTHRPEDLTPDRHQIKGLPPGFPSVKGRGKNGNSFFKKDFIYLKREGKGE